MTRGVDEGDLALVAVDLGGHLVGADGLGDAAGLAADHVGLADRVEQLGLAVVDVTHDGDHRRAGREILLAALVLAELDVEALQQLAVLVLGRDDLDVVVELGAEHLQRVVADRLGGRDHLAEVEQHLDQRRHLDADLLGQVGQRRAPGEPDLLAVTLAYAYAADLGRLHLVELLTTLLLGLAPPAGRATGAPEGTLGAAATAATTATAGRRTTGATTGTAAPGRATGTGTPATGRGSTATTSAGTGGSAELAGALLGHHRRVRAGHAGNAGTATRGRRTADGRPGAAGPGGIDPRGLRAGRGARAVPMPWEEENGLLPGRGAPGRRSRGVPAPGRPPVDPGRGRGAALGPVPGPGSRAAGGRRGRVRRTRRGGRSRTGRRRAGGRSRRGCGGGRRRRHRSGSRGRRRWGRERGRGRAPGAWVRARGPTRPVRLDEPVADRGRALAALGAAGLAAALRAGFLAAGGSLGELFLEAPLDRSLHGGGCGADELPHVFQHGQNCLAFDSELFRKLVDTDLGHCSPCWRSVPRCSRTS